MVAGWEVLGGSEIVDVGWGLEILRGRFDRGFGWRVLRGGDVG